ncbi:unnamed protein product [Periconia digitata]|uniref:DH domain-containing protein n=1 Tax=Periconia digitata TaxID=1303443 RepID=A0A9W4USV7_9PLEO|nr:unnamed protein product [Periconia digitata]
MAEPDHTSMHNFAYHPSVASWVQSTALAQLDSASDEAAGQPAAAAPDDFYKPVPVSTPSAAASTDFEPLPSSSSPADMTTVRPRQQTPNGATRTTPRLSVRSVSGSVTSTTSTPRSAPQIPANRPTVRSLAQKFNQPTSADSSPSSSRAHPVRQPAAAAAKDAPSYGGYKFNNLKARESTSTSASNGRRTANGARSSLGQQQQPAPSPSPARKPVTSPTRGPGKKPFFGEVVGNHDSTTPGFGISENMEEARRESNSYFPAPTESSSTIKLVTEDVHPPPEASQAETLSPRRRRPTNELHSQTPQAEPMTPQPTPPDGGTPRKNAPPSRIPVASRRMSASSNSSSSTRSSKFAGVRPAGHNMKSPSKMTRVPVGRTAIASRSTSKPTAADTQQMLPAISYRGYRERGKSPQAANTGPSVSAVITAPPPPTSPRLRNSRERQLLQESPGPGGSSAKTTDPYATQDYFTNGDTPITQTLQMINTEPVVSKPSVKLVYSDPESQNVTNNMPSQQDVPVIDSGQDAVPQGSLSLSTAGLPLPPAGQSLSTATSFEYDDSPILGMPGSFLTTPPLAQHTPPTNSNQSNVQKEQVTVVPPQGHELLQARAFQPPSAQNEQTQKIREAQTHTPEPPSEIGFRESIPIMLGVDGANDAWDPLPSPPKISPRIDTAKYNRSSDSTPHAEEESPIDPFRNRDSIRPEDSASMVAYPWQSGPPRQWDHPNVADPLAVPLGSEAHNAIKNVLNTYHSSEAITPEVAQDAKMQINKVSPLLAQHQSWDTKEATETYLARLLSDVEANAQRKPVERPRRQYDRAISRPASRTSPFMSPFMNSSIRALTAEPEEPSTGGTAIIFPTESKRYSRGSRTSNASTTTTIWEGTSRPDSSSGVSLRGPSGTSPGVMPSNLGHSREDIHSHEEQKQRGSSAPLTSTVESSSGLSLPMPASQHQFQSPAEPPQHTPPRPPYSPPPPPGAPKTVDRLLGETLQEFAQQGPRIRPPIPVTQLSSQFQSGAEVLPSETVPSPASFDPTQSEERASLAEEPQFDKATLLVRKRYRVIEELTKTEHSFCVDMMVAHQIFEGTSKDVLTDAERRLLFSNCRDLEAFSHDLWKRLKDAIRPVVNQTPPSENSSEPYDEFICCTPDNDRQVRIGEIMLQATQKMERVYTTYYLNYSDASDFIKKNQDNPELLGWVMACFQHCPNLTTAWDLDSLLVKPCQRMLKYPILLDDLIAKTDPDHPDLSNLKKANENIKAIALRIEDAKSRQQTLRAATSEGKKAKKKGRFSNNIVKSLISNKDRAKNLQEAALVFEDQEYNQITQKFGGHFFQIQIVIRDFDQYLDAISEQMLHLNRMMHDFIDVAEVGPSASPEQESTWRVWTMAHLELQNKALAAHKVNIRERAMKPISEVWDQWVQPQKLMEQRKKLLLSYAKYKQMVERKEKIDPKLEEAAKDFLTINDSLKLELPRLYELTKKVIRVTEIIFLGIQKDWYKICSKKILPLLEKEPQHTTSITFDLKTYTEQFNSDYRQVETKAQNMHIINHELLPNHASPAHTFYSDDGSSRKSSSRRTESIGSEYSSLEKQRNRSSGGYASMRSNVRSYDGHPPRSSPAAPYTGGSALPSPTTPGPANPYSRAAERAISPSYSQASESTVTSRGRSSSGRQPPAWGLDGALDNMQFAQPPSAGPSFLNTAGFPTSNSNTLVSSTPGSTRTSGVFNSALPMSDAPAELSATSTNDPDAEVEVLFLAASLFEFNIAHDRREGGIPYLVYVPGEIFDVIGMKGELWLARNQDDPTKTVGWIWEKHFARILPDEA